MKANGSMKNSDKDVYYIEVVGRALDVLEVFAQEQKSQLSLKEIADRVDQSMNTVFRLLYTLAAHGFIVKTNKQYELGSKLLDLTRAKMRHTDVVALARPHMDALLGRFRETVNLGVIMDGKVRYVEVRESPERFRLVEQVGGTDPLHCTALGKAHLAFLPFAEVRDLLKIHGMPKVTEHTLAHTYGPESRPRDYTSPRLRNRSTGKHAWWILHCRTDSRWERKTGCRNQCRGSLCAFQ